MMTRDEMVGRLSALHEYDKETREKLTDAERVVYALRGRRYGIESEISSLKARIAKLDAYAALAARLLDLPTTTVKSQTGKTGIKRWILKVTPKTILMLDQLGQEERYQIDSGRCGIYKIEDINATLSAWEAHNAPT